MVPSGSGGWTRANWVNDKEYSGCVSKPNCCAGGPWTDSLSFLIVNLQESPRDINIISRSELKYYLMSHKSC